MNSKPTLRIDKKSMERVERLTGERGPPVVRSKRVRMLYAVNEAACKVALDAMLRSWSQKCSSKDLSLAARHCLKHIPATRYAR